MDAEAIPVQITCNDGCHSTNPATEVHVLLTDRAKPAATFVCSICGTYNVKDIGPTTVKVLRVAALAPQVMCNVAEMDDTVRHDDGGLTREQIEEFAVMLDRLPAARPDVPYDWATDPGSGFLAAPARDITWPTTRTRLGAYINAQWRGRRGCATCGGPRECLTIPKCLRCVATGGAA